MSTLIRHILTTNDQFGNHANPPTTGSLGLSDTFFYYKLLNVMFEK